MDDNPELLEETASFPRDEGFRVNAQLGPFGATAVLGREKPDVVVLDVKMPGPDGNRSSAVMRERQEVPIVYFSAIPEEELRNLARQTSGCSYVLRSEGCPTS